MSGHRLIDVYLKQLERALVLEPAAKARVLEEIRDHLLSAVEDEERRGYRSVDAERRAIERFGSPAAIAAQFSSLASPRSAEFASRPRPRRRLRPIREKGRSPMPNSKPAGKAKLGCCSFCGKAREMVRELVDGPEVVAICDECLLLCAEIISSERGRQTPTASPANHKRTNTDQGGRVSTFFCSFCGHEHAEVERLIAGPNFVFICNECVKRFTKPIPAG